MKSHNVVQLAAIVALVAAQLAAAEPPSAVITPNGSSLRYVMDHGVKVFHLGAEPVKRELAPGMVINAWGYNGQTPGPTVEAVEGGPVRILVTNKLPDAPSGPWHRVLL